MAFCSQAGDFSLIAFRPSTVCRLRCFFSTRLMVLAAGLSGQRLLAAAWLKKSTNGARHWLAEHGVNLIPTCSTLITGMGLTKLEALWRERDADLLA